MVGYPILFIDGKPNIKRKLRLTKQVTAIEAC